MDKLKEFFKKKSVIITLSVILAVLLIAAGFAWYIYPCDYVARGVMVENTAIGRLTKEEAETAIATDSIPEGVIITVTDETGALAEIKGDTVRISFADGSSPSVIHDTSDASAIYVLMPMRV